MLEPFFHGRSVLVRPLASWMGGPAFSFGSLGSGPTAIVPGNGFKWRMIPGLNSVVMVFASSLKYCTCPSGNSEASKPMVGNCLPGRLKLKPESLITIFLMRISMVSPGSAPFTKMGPVTECGPPPGLARRSLTMSSIEAPGLTSSSPWRSEEHTSELQSPDHLVCRLLLEKKKTHEVRTTIVTCLCQ